MRIESSFVISPRALVGWASGISPGSLNCLCLPLDCFDIFMFGAEAAFFFETSFLGTDFFGISLWIFIPRLSLAKITWSRLAPSWVSNSSLMTLTASTVLSLSRALASWIAACSLLKGYWAWISHRPFFGRGLQTIYRRSKRPSLPRLVGYYRQSQKYDNVRNALLIKHGIFPQYWNYHICKTTSSGMKNVGYYSQITS